MKYYPNETINKIVKEKHKQFIMMKREVKKLQANNGREF